MTDDIEIEAEVRDLMREHNLSRQRAEAIVGARRGERARGTGEEFFIEQSPTMLEREGERDRLTDAEDAREEQSEQMRRAEAARDNRSMDVSTMQGNFDCFPAKVAKTFYGDTPPVGVNASRAQYVLLERVGVLRDTTYDYPLAKSASVRGEDDSGSFMAQPLLGVDCPEYYVADDEIVTAYFNRDPAGQHLFTKDEQPFIGQVTAVTSITTWATGTVYAAGAWVIPTTANDHYYFAQDAGTSHAATEPTWPTDGSTVVDNTGANQITWLDAGTTKPSYVTVNRKRWESDPDASGHIGPTFGNNAKNDSGTDLTYAFVRQESDIANGQNELAVGDWVKVWRRGRHMLCRSLLNFPHYRAVCIDGSTETSGALSVEPGDAEAYIDIVTDYSSPMIPGPSRENDGTYIPCVAWAHRTGPQLSTYPNASIWDLQTYSASSPYATSVPQIVVFPWDMTAGPRQFDSPSPADSIALEITDTGAAWGAGEYHLGVGTLKYASGNDGADAIIFRYDCKQGVASQALYPFPTVGEQTEVMMDAASNRWWEVNRPRIVGGWSGTFNNGDGNVVTVSGGVITNVT